MNDLLSKQLIKYALDVYVLDPKAVDERPLETNWQPRAMVRDIKIRTKL
jgi:hypothetical protein